ncbi:FxsB family radical SAM/SPASM domain protein [Actinospica sp. MGRD01-02]|uniref:FxsB family radical SAM/SPASM domain protein n=1 Tax=Actinospica acidithermotolerans TaxID=2828514 RepID=A0A941IHL2_9ACTN|nr:FxsB family cyclophane-forming radical SAM/SPASM peptide maturase [Actinospica acidithermotolerans]MBR7825298.1 FxsB family radical SAM/SPASM domain protein [Actinospica acidithermotolerans]
MSSQFTPFRQFVVKVHSRCDLACDHCYMYEAVDQGWRRQPMVMSADTAAALGRRIAEHAAEGRLDLVRVVLHGGEPLLAGVGRLREIIEAVREPLLALPEPPRLDLRIHTNGVRLDERFLELFAEFHLKVGISLDGDRSANDRHRRYANGNSSHAQVLAALELLRSPRYRHLYAGILCTVDIANDPVAVYRAVAAEQPPRIDLLLPHATWDCPPPRPDGISRPSTSADPAYAAWLLAVYEAWNADGRPFGIRLFDSIHSTLRGGPPLTEALGVAPSDVLVIETDGALEQADSLKVAFDGAVDTGLRVQDHPLSAATVNAQVMARQNGPDGLSGQCRSCPVLTSCGGGLFAHRYRGSDADPDGSAAAFRNPSVYCADLLELIQSIQKAESADMAFSAGTTVTRAHFDELASGLGGTAAIGELADTQASINRTLLAAAGQALAEQTTEGSWAWQLLQILDEKHPAAVAKAVSHPFFRAAAFRAIDDPVSAHPGTLIGYALAAASHAGLAAELPVPLDTASVYLPGIGLIATADGKAALEHGGQPREFIARSRYVGGEDGPRVLLEDLDEQRDAFQLPPTNRLTDDEFAHWAAAYGAAWQLIKRQYGEYVPGLEAGLRVIAPLMQSPDGHAASGTARQAFGALGLALPADPDVLALLLIHEFQHVKLGALMDMFDLYDSSDTRLYYAPWREDPRPLEGLLQGVYAHVAVVDFWRRAFQRGDAKAAVHFARWRAQTWQAIEQQLETSGSLTEHGAHLVSGLKAAMAPWMEIPLAAEVLDEASRKGDEHRSAFRSSESSAVR